MSRPNRPNTKQPRTVSSPRTKQPPSIATKRLPVHVCAAKIAADPSPSQRIQDLQDTVACHALHIGSQARHNPHKEKRSRHLSREAVFGMLRERFLHDPNEDVRYAALSLLRCHFPQDREIISLLFSALPTASRTRRNNPIYHALETAFASSAAHEMRREVLLQAHQLTQQPPWHTIHIDPHPAQAEQAEETLLALERYLPSSWIPRILEDGLTAPTENTFAHAARLLGAALSRPSPWLAIGDVTRHIRQITAPLLEPYTLPITRSWREQRTHQDNYLRALILLALIPLHYAAPFLGALHAILRYTPETAERPFYLHEHERIRYMAMLCLLRFFDQLEFVEEIIVQETRTAVYSAYNSRNTHNLLRLLPYIPQKNNHIARWLLAHLTQPYNSFAQTSLPLLARFPNEALEYSIALLPEHETTRLHTLLSHFYLQNTEEIGSAAFRLLACLPTYQELDAWLNLAWQTGITHAPALLHHFCHTPPAPLKAIYLFERWRSAHLLSLQREQPTHLRARESLYQLISIIRAHKQHQALTPHQLGFWRSDLEDALMACSS